MRTWVCVASPFGLGWEIRARPGLTLDGPEGGGDRAGIYMCIRDWSIDRIVFETAGQLAVVESNSDTGAGTVSNRWASRFVNLVSPDVCTVVVPCLPKRRRPEGAQCLLMIGTIPRRRLPEKQLPTKIHLKMSQSGTPF